MTLLTFWELLHHRILGSPLFPRADKACIWQVFSLCLLDKQPLFGLHWHWESEEVKQR